MTTRKAAGKPLTPRQTEVLVLVAQGMSDKEVARKLGLESQSARDHMKNILQRLGLKRRIQAAVWAAKAGLV